MSAASPAIIHWVALHILPEEPTVRAYLRRQGVPSHDIDDIVQEAYCRFANMACVDHIDRPGAYFLQTARNLWRDQLRRAAIIPFENITETARCLVMDETGNTEQLVAARQQLRMVERLLAVLPERCRRIFALKRIDGLSQKQIAQSLGVSESVVENDVQKALRLLQAELQSQTDWDKQVHQGNWGNIGAVRTRSRRFG